MWFLSVPSFDWGENVVIFGAGKISSVHIDKKKKDIPVLSKGPTEKLDDTKITVEAKYSISFQDPCNGSNSILFVNAIKMYQFKARYIRNKTIFIVHRKNFKKISQLIT